MLTWYWISDMHQQHLQENIPSKYGDIFWINIYPYQIPFNYDKNLPKCIYSQENSYSWKKIIKIYIKEHVKLGSPEINGEKERDYWQLFASLIENIAKAVITSNFSSSTDIDSFMESNSSFTYLLKIAIITWHYRC